MEKERKITAPEGCEIEKVEIVDGVAVITFREKERKLPKSWEEFCEMFPDYTGEYFVEPDNENKIGQVLAMNGEKRENRNAELLPDRASAEAVLALCQLIQLRNAYNGDFKVNWIDTKQYKYVIGFDCGGDIKCDCYIGQCITYLFFKSADLRDEFLRYFRPLIEKLKPLYGIKEGGEEC